MVAKLKQTHTSVENLQKEIMERMQVETALKESEGRFRALFEQAAVGMAEIDTATGRFIRINRHYCDMVGYTMEELLNLTFHKITYPEDLDADIDNMALLVSGKTREFSMEKRYVRKDGKIIWVNITVSPLWEPGEPPVRNIAVVQDITERKHVEEDIRKLNADLDLRVQERTSQLEAANRELDAFSYSVSHDLKSPLQHITGYAELLNKRASESLDEKNKHYLKVITDSTIRMGRLIDDLLSFSRMGRTEMLKKKTNLDSLVKEILRDFQADARSKNIDWKTGPLPEVYGDSAMLRQVFVNLISNAFKFTGNCDEAVIEIGSTIGENGEVCVYVKDNGVGFDMKYVDKLFGIFQRLHSSKEFEGTGIGLANVRRIIHRHGGRVWAEGKVGEGATFYFTLSA